MNERPVASPCVHVCALDEQDICIGCQRTAAEITRWGLMSNDERREVLGRCFRARQGARAGQRFRLKRIPFSFISEVLP